MDDDRTTLLSEGPLAGSWRILATLGETPTPRVNATLTLSENGEHSYLFGGFDSEKGKCLSDLWVLDLPSATWRQVEAPDDDILPPARYGHTAAILGSKLVIFGLYSCDCTCVIVYCRWPE